MIKIYGPQRSSAWRCMWALEEVGQEYEHVNVNIREREHKSAEYLKLNPNGKVPTLVDGDFVLWESFAINTYLAERYMPELLGHSVQEHALVNQWGYWAMANLNHPFETLLSTMWGVQLTDEVRTRAQDEVHRLLAILENALGADGYLVGNHFTLADLNVGAIAMYGNMLKMDYSAYPNITTWLAMCASRPAFQKVAPAQE